MTHRSLRFGADLNLHVEVPQLPQLPNFPQLIARKFNGLQLVEVEGTATSSSTSSTCQATDLIGKNEVEELREFRPPTGGVGATSSARPHPDKAMHAAPACAVSAYLYFCWCR